MKLLYGEVVNWLCSGARGLARELHDPSPIDLQHNIDRPPGRSGLEAYRSKASGVDRLLS
jgi:hypothetical protein